jgi:hypothetical protein
MVRGDGEVATAGSGCAFPAMVVTPGGQRWPMTDPLARREG